MREATVRLMPGVDEQHTELRLTVMLPRRLDGWQLADLSLSLRSWARVRLRVVLPAVASSAWSDDWLAVLEEASMYVDEVTFLAPRKPGGRRDR